MKIHELIREDDVEDVTGGVRKIAGDLAAGYNAGKSDAKDAIQKRKDAIQKLNDKELPLIKDATKQFLISFFDGFPNRPDPAQITKLITNKQTGQAVFSIFKEVADDVTKLKNGINNAASKIIPGGQKTVEKLAEIAQNKGKPTPELTNFVRKEIDFFKRMVILDNRLQIDLPHAASQLNTKMVKTQDGRRTDAIMALNWVFSWMESTIRAYADEIAKHTATFPEKQFP